MSDSSLYVLDNEFSSNDRPLIMKHLYLLKSALHEFPDSKYNYLMDMIEFDSARLKSVENEMITYSK